MHNQKNQTYFVHYKPFVKKEFYFFRSSVIRLGENYVNSAIDCDGEICAEPVQDLHPEVIISHKNYGTPPYHNDIGLVRLREKPILNGIVLIS